MVKKFSNSSPSFTGIVHLRDLPDKGVYLDIYSQYKFQMLNLARNLAGGRWNDLAKELKIKIPEDKSSTLIRSFRRGNLASLFFIKNISNFLVSKGYVQYELKKLEKNVSLLSVKNSKYRINNPKFPFNFNTKEGAIVISIMFHDGGITVRDLEPFYSNFSLELKYRVKNSVKKLVGEINFWEREKEISFPKILGLILTCVGLIPGRRTINNPRFPLFVFKYNKESIIEFLSQAVADDGWVYSPDEGFGFVGFNFTIDLTKFTEDKRQNIRKNKLRNYMPNTLLGDIFLFEKLGCKVSGPYFGNEKRYLDKGKEYRYTQEWRFQIRGYHNLRLLAETLKVPLQYKQEKLLKESCKVRLRKV